MRIKSIAREKKNYVEVKTQTQRARHRHGIVEARNDAQTNCNIEHTHTPRGSTSSSGSIFGC